MLGGHSGGDEILEWDATNEEWEEMGRMKQSRYCTVTQNLHEVQLEYDSLKKSLHDNETYVQLTNLERKWQVLEQNNFAISEFISNKKAESNFEPIKNRVLKLQWEYNKMLQESLKKT